MNVNERNIKRRRQVFGAALLLLSVLLLAVALWGRIRRLSYVAMGLAAIGMWMVSQRAQD